MSHIDLSPSQTELQQRASAFAQDVLASRAADIDRTNWYPWDIVEKLTEAGFFGLTLPVEFGGAGRPLIDAILVTEEIAKVSGVVARIVVDANTAVQKTVAAFGTHEQKARYLAKIARGDKPAIAITEPEAGSAATWLTTAAYREAGHFVLSGEKRWITGAGVSGFYLVFARFDDVPGARGIGALLVDADTPGVSVTRAPLMMGLRGMPEGELVFDNCRIPAANLLVAPGDGFRQLMQCYNLQRIGAAAVALGIAQGAFDLAIAYALQRKQFGKPIADFQGIQWMLADMYIQLEAARGLVHGAARSGAAGFPDKLQAATAKVYAAEAAISVTNAALQVFGAIGYSCDLPIERMVRDARMFTIGGGTAQVQRNLIASEILALAEQRTRGAAASNGLRLSQEQAVSDA